MDKGYFESRLGTLEIVSEGDFLVAIRRVNIDSQRCLEQATAFIEEVKRQLSEYFSGERKKFDLKTRLYISGFGYRVLSLLAEVPFGKTVTYGELAEAAGNKRACRFVGGCVHKNPIPIIIPCHRVVAKGGIGGFGWGIDAKRTLLELEGVHL